MRRHFYPYSSDRPGEFFATSISLLLTGSNLILDRGADALTLPFSTRQEVLTKLASNWALWGFNTLGDIDKVTTVATTDLTRVEFDVYISIPEDSPYYLNYKSAIVSMSF